MMCEQTMHGLRPSTPLGSTGTPCEAVLQERGITYVPGKAANAGGVAVSGLEMAQNSQRVQHPRATVDASLQRIMHSMYGTIRAAAPPRPNGGYDLEAGANRAAFLRVVGAMRALGWTA